MSWQATAAVTAHSKQRGSALLMLLMIANHADSTGGAAFMSVGTLAEETKMGDRNVRILLRKLEDEGELVRYGVHRKGTYLYGIVLPGLTPRESLFRSNAIADSTDAIAETGEDRIEGSSPVNFRPGKNSLPGRIAHSSAPATAITAKQSSNSQLEKDTIPPYPPMGGESDGSIRIRIKDWQGKPPSEFETHHFWGFPLMPDGRYFAGDNAGYPVFFSEEELDDFAGAYLANVAPGAQGPVLRVPELGAEMPQDGEEDPFAVSPGLNGASETSPAKSKQRRAKDSDDEPIGFTDLWNDYPRHAAKADARKAFTQVGLDKDEGMRELARLAIAEQRLAEPKFDEGGRYCPYFATWLRGRRWEDEIKTEQDSAIAYNFPARRITEVGEADQAILDQRLSDSGRRAAERERLYDALGIDSADQVRWRNLGDRLNRQSKRGLPKVWRESLFYPPQANTASVVIAIDADAVASLKATASDTRRMIESEVAKEWPVVGGVLGFHFFTRAELIALRGGE